MRRASTVIGSLLVLSCSGVTVSPPPSDTPSDAGATCLVVDWNGRAHELPLVVDAASASFGLVVTTRTFQADVCDCGFAKGNAACTVNPSTHRWDGSCINCSGATFCRRFSDGQLTQGGEPCRCGVGTGVGYCAGATGGDELCACPENCPPVPTMNSACAAKTCDGGTALELCLRGGSTHSCTCLELHDGGR